MMPTEKHRLSVTFPNGMFDEIVNYQEANGLRSQSSAIIELLSQGIAEFNNSDSVSPPAQPSDEAKLLSLHRQLNKKGQARLLDYADDLVSSGKYERDERKPALIAARGDGSALEGITSIDGDLSDHEDDLIP